MADGPASRRENRGESRTRLPGRGSRECRRTRVDWKPVITGSPEENGGWRGALATRSFDPELLEKLIQGNPNSALRLGVKGRGDNISTRSLLFRRGVFGPRPLVHTGRRLVFSRHGGLFSFHVRPLESRRPPRYYCGTEVFSGGLRQGRDSRMIS